MDFEKALQNPEAQFNTPKEILDEPSLTRAQKIEILRQWEYDARELEVAEEENMAGGPPSLLGEILHLLKRLDSNTEDSPHSPTKQGGE